jgi:hypothetical protein
VVACVRIGFADCRSFIRDESKDAAAEGSSDENASEGDEDGDGKRFALLCLAWTLLHALPGCACSLALFTRRFVRLKGFSAAPDPFQLRDDSQPEQE